MAFLHSSWRFLATLAVLCLLPLGLGCGGKKDAAASTETPSIKVSGTVTYIRKPLAVGADGIPTGLKTDTADFVSLPLRGVAVRAFQGKVETDASGNSVTVWKVVNSTNTTAEGKYSLSVAPGVSTFIEVASSMSPLSGSILFLHLLLFQDMCFNHDIKGWQNKRCKYKCGSHSPHYNYCQRTLKFRAAACCKNHG